VQVVGGIQRLKLGGGHLCGDLQHRRDSGFDTAILGRAGDRGNGI
jgi:hypothetical protein